MNESKYVEWLKKQGIPLFKGGGIYWRLYQGALIPAQATPCFVELSCSEAKDLLKESGAYLIRYSSAPGEKETEWWYLICDSYNPDKLSSNTRSKINRGFRSCTIRYIDAEWLAQYGYECYLSAFSRYKNAIPIKEEIFSNNILSTVGGPFEYRGVFIKDRLTGYCQCIVEDFAVSTNVIKFHPAYLKHYTSYALINTMINHYVVEKGMTMSNGARSIFHDTNFQDFLLKLGFRKQYCRLNVIYQPWLRVIIQNLFPFKGIIAKLPNRSLLHKVQSLLYQEMLRRACSVG